MTAEALAIILAAIGTLLGVVLKRLVLDRIRLLEAKIVNLERQRHADHLLITHHHTFRLTVTSLARQDPSVDSSLIIQLDAELDAKLALAQKLAANNRKKKD